MSNEKLEAGLASDLTQELGFNDFKPINFGIFIAEKDGNKFIFQRPFAFDKKRLAQSRCVLLINGKVHDVFEFEDAIYKCNEWIKHNTVIKQD